MKNLLGIVCDHFQGHRGLFYHIVIHLSCALSICPSLVTTITQEGNEVGSPHLVRVWELIAIIMSQMAEGYLGHYPVFLKYRLWCWSIHKKIISYIKNVFLKIEKSKYCWIYHGMYLSVKQSSQMTSSEDHPSICHHETSPGVVFWLIGTYLIMQQLPDWLTVSV